MRALSLLVSLAVADGCSTAPMGPSHDTRVDQKLQEIEAAFDDPRRVHALIAGAPEDQRWNLLFGYGELAGKRLDLSAASGRTASLPDEEARWHFWDGYAHSAPWPGDDPAVHIARIRMLAGERVHGALEDGVLMRFTERHAREPALVVDYAARWSALTTHSPTNGVRIGLQRALGDDMPAAIAVAASFPPEWQPDLYEELGWRVGADAKAAEASTRALVDSVPVPSRCAFVHGSVRGHALHRSLDEGVDLARSLDALCPDEAWRAIGWTLHQIYPYESVEVEKFSTALGAAERARVMEGYRRPGFN